MKHTLINALLFTTDQISQMIRACVSTAFAIIATASMAAQPCAPAGGTAGFLPANGGRGGHGGDNPIICGLPESQNPILGAGPEQEGKRAEQRAAWTRLLKEMQRATPVKTQAINQEVIDLKSAPPED